MPQTLVEPHRKGDVLYFNKFQQGTLKFTYLRTHLPTGKEHVLAVWVKNFNDGYKLLDSWNRAPEYKYRSWAGY